MTPLESKVGVHETINDIRNILNIDQSLTGLDYLKVLVNNISRILDVKYVFIGQTSESSDQAIHTDVVWGNGKYLKNFDYELASTPCEIVMTGDRVCIHSDSVIEKFPDDKLLENMGIESYVGAPTISPSGELLGLLVLLDDKPLQDCEHLVATVDFLAQRVTAEYERFNIEKNLNSIIDKRTLQLQHTISELETIKKQLEIKSRTDALTQVNNREWFTACAESQLKMAKRHDYPVSLLFIDLDLFKLVNDTYGHGVGDDVLSEAAQRIKQCTRDADILGRFGGEEFVLLSPYSETDTSKKLASRILNALSELPILTADKVINITASIGIASSDNVGLVLKSLIKSADQALYQAKDNGRNTFVLAE